MDAIKRELAACTKGRKKEVAHNLGLCQSAITESLNGKIKTVDRLFDIADACGKKFILTDKSGKNFADILSLKDAKISQAIEILKSSIDSETDAELKKTYTEDEKVNTLLDRMDRMWEEIARLKAERNGFRAKISELETELEGYRLKKVAG